MRVGAGTRRGSRLQPGPCQPALAGILGHYAITQVPVGKGPTSELFKTHKVHIAHWLGQVLFLCQVVVT